MISDPLDRLKGKNLLPCYLVFLSILRQEARRGSGRYSTTWRTWCHELSLISNTVQIAPIRGANILMLLIYFFTSTPSRLNLFAITGTKVIVPIVSVVWERFSIWLLQNLHDRPDSTLSKWSRSSLSSGSFAIVPVEFPYDCFDRLNIRDLKQQDGKRRVTSGARPTSHSTRLSQGVIS